MAFRPYLFFGNNCRAAFTRYQEIFGGELVIMTMGDAPSDEPVPPEMADVVIHAALMVGDELLMGSEDPTTDSFGPVQGMVVSFNTADADEAKRVFEALSEGGTVTQGLMETFFSPAFGMCVDAFGTPWMVATDSPAPYGRGEG
jgi:PhnB protein